MRGCGDKMAILISSERITESQANCSSYTQSAKPANSLNFPVFMELQFIGKHLQYGCKDK